jgi:hypothetical protein
LHYCVAIKELGLKLCNGSLRKCCGNEIKENNPCLRCNGTDFEPVSCGIECDLGICDGSGNCVTLSRVDETCYCQEMCGEGNCVENVCRSKCGNNVCESDENCWDCPQDCSCSIHDCCVVGSKFADAKGCIKSGNVPYPGIICCNGIISKGSCCSDRQCKGGICVEGKCQKKFTRPLNESVELRKKEWNASISKDFENMSIERREFIKKRKKLPLFVIFISLVFGAGVIIWGLRKTSSN